jgi:phage FluMu protein Com
MHYVGCNKGDFPMCPFCNKRLIKIQRHFLYTVFWFRWKCGKCKRIFTLTKGCADNVRN